jgi:translocation and assembly module TamB
MAFNRRALVALVSAALMIFIGAVAIGGLVAATQSEGGREWIRSVAEAQLARALRAKVHLGTLSGSFLTDLRVDSVRIADLDDSTFVATGPVRVTFDPRDLADGRIILRSVEVERPFVAVRREFDGAWTHEKLFPRREGRRVRRSRTAFGAVFVVQQASVRDGEFALLLPWAPDSAPRARVTRAWRWQNIALDLPRGRFAYPDSAGIHLEIARLDVDERDPPFAFREVAGTVRIAGDTLRAELSRFTLPGSAGRAVGRVTWGRGEPARYAFRVDGDSVALADVAWINPAIPNEGGGRMRLDIRNSPSDPQLVEYVITQMDVRAHASRLSGQMTWGVRGRDVALRNVDLEMAPLDAALIRRFNRGPLPIPLEGRLVGRLRARGGPLSAFVVDDANATFYDRNVPGATARARARGTVDISDPAVPVFDSVAVDLASFDLRTAQAWEATLPKLNGTLSGRAVLDSAWGDLRLEDADITHVDGAAPASRLVGRARLRWDAESPLRWDLAADALPISFTALAQSFPAWPLRGEYEGPLRTSGTADDLTIVTAMSGPAGRFSTNLRLDNALPSYRVIGSLRSDAVDPRLLFADARAPEGELSGTVRGEVGFETLADLIGEVDLDLERSFLSGVRIFAGRARLTFADGLARVDTLALETSAADVAAVGALGLDSGYTDTLRLRIRMDSLGGFRPLLDRPVGDSLAGSALLDARLRGWVRDFAADVTANGSGLVFAGNRATVAQFDAALLGLPAAPGGSVALQGDTLTLAGLRLHSLRADAALAGTEPAGISLRAAGQSGTQLAFGGLLSLRPDSTALLTDSLTLRTALHAWDLVAPARLSVARGGFRLDSLALAASGGSRLTLAGGLPAEGALDFRLRGRDVPMADVAELLQRPELARGGLDADLRFGGTRAAPTFDADAELRGGLVRGIRLDTLTARVVAQRDRLDLRLALGRRQAPMAVADVTLPVLLDLDGDGLLMRDDGAVTGRVTADSVDLGLFESLTRGVGGARGSLQLALALGGTWARPTATGDLRVRNGALAPPGLGDVRWRNVEADIGFLGDSIAIRSIAANSPVQGLSRPGRLTLGGWVSLRNREDPRLDVRVTSRAFNVYAKPGTADVDLSGELRLAGSVERATLSGALTADRAIIAIPELAAKDVISLQGPDRFAALDTLVFAENGGAQSALPDFLQNLTVANVPITMGGDVWIRSSEANINLGGQVSVTRGRIARGPDAGQVQLAVTGPLQTVRGTYRLNLGPVQRTFTVEQGEIRFFGDPEFNPSLNVTALHTVRQYSQQGVRPDVRVRVHLGGTLRQPTAELSTPDSMRVTNADLVSYLVTGGPSFEIARDGNVSATAARVVLGSLGSVLGSKVAGGLCDDAQVTTAGLDAYQGSARDVGGGILSGSRFNCAKQVGDRAFVRLDAGLCGVGQFVSQNGGSNALSFGDALGVKFDYLLGRGFSASFGVEPPTSAMLCASDASNSARGFVPTPRQVGVDLFRAWRF